MLFSAHVNFYFLVKHYLHNYYIILFIFNNDFLFAITLFTLT